MGSTEKAWWLGFHNAREMMRMGSSFRRAITPIMRSPLRTAWMLSILHSNIPEWKHREFAARILKEDILTPTLLEIEIAAHFHTFGYHIEWFENPMEEGVRSPEFIAERDSVQIEVECKAKMVDSGRRVERKSFYRTIDDLLPIINNNDLCGAILLTFPNKFPTQPSWRSQAVYAFEQQLSPGKKTISLESGERFICDLHTMDGSEVSVEKIAFQMAANVNPFAHFAVSGIPSSNAIRDPLIFRLESEKKDAFLESVLDSLRSAENQFTGTRAAIICCMIPEIISFEGLRVDSAIHDKTIEFFDKYSRNCVNAITYIGEERQNPHGSVMISEISAITFRNHKYDTGFGPDIPVFVPVFE
jgi:hypothetical protein